MRRGRFVVRGRVATVQRHRRHIVHVAVALRIGGGARPAVGRTVPGRAAAAGFGQLVGHIVIAHH